VKLLTGAPGRYHDIVEHLGAISFDAISVAGNVAPCDNVVENVSDNVVENAGDDAERRWASAREALANSCKTRASYGGASTFCGQ
jgi:hypothetical protein